MPETPKLIGIVQLPAPRVWRYAANGTVLTTPETATHAGIDDQGRIWYLVSSQLRTVCWRAGAPLPFEAARDDW